ncbi:MAG: hypothetical protein U0232_08465 [Thermomicrobiales bacterium]
MRLLTRKSFLLGALLLGTMVALPGVAADTGWAPLTINSTRITAPAGSFEPSDSILFWFNTPNGGAAPFVTDATGTVTATTDGGLDVTVAASDWARIPASATSIVAFGRASGNYAVATLATAGQQDLTLHIDASHRIYSDKVFSPGERIVFWYNLSDGGACSPSARRPGVLRPRRRLDRPDLHRRPVVRHHRDATSLVAAGLYSKVAIGGVIPR